jgi:hypothetical protein
MIPAIGLMVGFFVITHMLALGTRKGDRAEDPLVRGFAFFTIIIALFCIFVLWTKGTSNPLNFFWLQNLPME